MLCVTCARDTVPDWAVCPVCGSGAPPAAVPELPEEAPPGNGRRLGDYAVAALLMVSLGLTVVDFRAAASGITLVDLTIRAVPVYPAFALAAALLLVRRTADAGAGMAFGLLTVILFPIAVDYFFPPKPPVQLFGVAGQLQGTSATLTEVLALVLCAVAGRGRGRFTLKADGRWQALAGVLPLVYLAGCWLPWERIPVATLSGPGYEDCCSMFRYDQQLVSDDLVVLWTCGAVVVVVLAGLVASPRVAGGLVLATACYHLPWLVTRGLVAAPLPGYWIALAASAAMIVLAFVMLTRPGTAKAAPRGGRRPGDLGSEDDSEDDAVRAAPRD
ncbi:hypothetical protein [Microbispora sp. NPDC049125]|uniref:hypothetical protein n=1 Tax=Microbispora sp. NPDC049125 TaxID=3154929 RepID=UPI0034673881